MIAFATMAQRTTSTIARLLMLGLVASCYGGDPLDQTVEDINVCHTTVVEGIDVSEFQGNIDWNAVHASGRQFAITRLGDGTYHDPTFARNWAGIRAAGMIRGAYLFWRPSSDPNAMADAIRTNVGHLGAGDLPFTIDVECMCPASARTCAVSGPGCIGTAAAVANLRTLVARVTADTGKAPMVYTGTWFWNGGTYLNGAASFPSLDLWVSGYTNGCVSVPSGWTDWRFWQYSDGTCAGCPVAGSAVPGVQSSPSVDRNKFNGTLAQLQAFAGMTAGPPDWAGQYVAQSFPLAAAGAVMLHAGESAPAYIEMRNVGGHAWDTHTRLGTTQPRDRTSVFAASDWAGPNRPGSVTGTVAPNGTFRFNFTLHAPSTPGTYTEYFGMLEEGVAWFSDSGQGGPPDNQLQARIVVLPAVATPDAGPPPPVDAGVHDAGSRDAGSPTSDAAAADVAQSDAADAPGPDDPSTTPDASNVRDGSPGDGAGDAAVATADSPSGCGCRVPGRSTPTSMPFGAVAVAIAATRRRRRARKA